MASEIRATVFTINEIINHPNAETLEIVRPLGWQVVTKKGLRHIGQQCVYIQPDSLIPDEWAVKWGVKAYLKGPQSNRVGKVELRGQPSFGFIVEIPEGQNWNDGDNVADFFGITKFIPPVKFTCSDAESPHPLFDKYTDIENLRNFPHVFNNGEEIVATEKTNGCNSRIGKIDGIQMAGSMELQRKKPVDISQNIFWFPWSIENVAKMVNSLAEKHSSIIVYGEIYGNKIQGGYVYDTPTGKLGYKVFDIKIDGKFLDHDDLVQICKENNVEMVPILYRGPYSLDIIKSISDGQTTMSASHIREGTVIRPIKERHHAEVGRLVMKYIGDSYLLSKHQDSKDQ